MEVLCVCGQWRSKDAFQWEFHVDLNRNASFISIEEDLQFEDLMKIVSEDFKEKVIGLSYGMSLDIKSTVEGFPPISVAKLAISEVLFGRVDHLMEPVGCVLSLLMMIQLAVTIKFLIHLLRLFLLSREKYRFILI
ncbi:BnaCnng66760D [Brassica napus]|uniref:BnaCnng66760D protein n=1 Tax=Brassica napus TaxID=3708 RepID=A0A078JX75_BRANA|nr:BnaCnng66760D [Brassica napus]